MIGLTKLRGFGGNVIAPQIITNGKLSGAAKKGYQVTVRSFPRPKKFYPTCKFFFGRRGTAKSLSMTFMAWGLSQAIDYHMGKAKLCGICHETHKPVRIAANYKCDFADIQDPYLVESLSSYPLWAHDLIVLIDEIAAYVPSSRAMSSVTLNVGTWLQQIRKRRIEIFMATQFPQDITRNVLRQVDYFMEPEPIDEGRHVKLFFYDIWGQFSGDYSYKKWPPTKEDSFSEKILPYTDRVWGLYDTNEVFAPVWSKDREAMIGEAGWQAEEQPMEGRDVLIAPDRTLVSDADDVEGYLRQLLTHRNTDSLNLKMVFNDVRERTGADWTNLNQMRVELEEKGWDVFNEGTGGNNIFARPPQ